MAYKMRLKKIIIISIIFALSFLMTGNLFPIFDKLFSKFKKDKTELRILAVSPAAGTEGLRETDAVTVTFSEPVVALKKLGEVLKTGPVKIKPHFPGTYKWLGTKIIAFYPDKPLPKNTGFSATVKKGLTSITGKKLKKDYIWNFETIRPRLRKSQPYNKSKWQRLDAYLYLYFTMPMKKKSVKNYINLSENGEGRKYKVRYIKTNELNRWDRRRYEKKDFDLKTGLVLIPVKKFLRSSKIELFINNGLPAIEGDLGTKNTSSFYFNTYNKFKYKGDTYQSILPENYRYCDVLYLLFSNPVEYRELYKHLYFKPEIKLPHERVKHSAWSTHRFCLTLNYQAETKYDLVIDKELKDKFGQKLNDDVKIEFNVHSFKPYFSIPTGIGVIEHYEGKKIPLTVCNPEDIKVKSKLFKKGEVIPFLLWKKYFSIPHNIRHTYKYVKSFGKEFKYDMETDLQPDVERNKYLLTPLYLSKYLKKKPQGFLALELSGMVYDKTRTRSTFLQVSGLGITSKFSAETNLIFLTELKTARPVKGAEIEIRDDFNKVLWQGITDKKGMVKTPGWLNFGLKRYSYNVVRQWAFARKGKDAAFINNEWGTGISPWRFGIRYSPTSLYPHFQGAVRSERGLYRPGETVHLKGVLRDKLKGDWKLPDVKELDFYVNDSRGSKIKEGKVRINKYGTFAMDIKIPEDSPTGYYSVRVFQKVEKRRRDRIKPYEERKLIPKEGKVNIRGSFRVEVFKPVQYEVRTWFEEKNYFLNDKVKFKVTGWYLFGAPMSDKKAHYTVNARETFYSPPDNPGFRFTKLQWLDDKYYRPKTKHLLSKTAKLNKKGELEIPVGLTIGEDIHAMNVTLEATVYGEAHQRVSGRGSLTAHGSEFYIGIRRSKYFVEKGKEAGFTIISVDPAGKRREGDKIKIEIFRRYWESVRKAETGGRYSWRCEKVDKSIMKKEIETEKKGVEISFKPEKTGLYFIKAVSRDKKERLARADDYIYSVGEGYAPWLMTDDDRIEIVPDKENYKPGDTARILVKSPYEECTALVTVEREFVMESWVKKLKGTAAVVDIPIKKKYLPNVFIGVALIKERVEDKSYTNYGTDLGKPAFKMGYAPINVSPEERHLKVEIFKKHDTRQPGEQLEFSFKVKDKKGKGVQSECMVAVCDVGVLNLIGFKTPDFFDTFFGPRPLGVMTSDTRLHIIGQRNYGEKGENRGGGGLGKAKEALRAEAGMDLFSFRKSFLSTAFYKAAHVTDKNGAGRIKFSLPDNLTSFRIMVSAITKKSSFGAGEDYVTVKKPLMLKSTLPQFAIVSDRFKAGAVVYNYTKDDADITVKIEADNLKIKGKNSKKVRIEKGGSADVRFDLECSRVGKVKVKIAAITGNNKDAIEKGFTVKEPRLVESVALFESMIDDDAFQKIVIPTQKEVFAGAGNLELYLSPSVFSGLKKGIDYLLEYPYGCLEQLVSKTLPIILSKKFILDLNLTVYTEKELDRIVNDIIKRIPDFQRYDGGFYYWPNGRWSSPWLTAHVCFALLRAEKEGYKINSKVLDRALKYIENYARIWQSLKNLPYSYYCHLSTLSFMAYILELGGRPNRTLVNYLYKNIDHIPFFGKANLLKAMYISKYKKNDLDKVRQVLFNNVKVASTTAHYEDENMEKLYWIHSSSVRATSMVLQAFMETKTINPLNDKVAKWLVRGRKLKGRYNNTQENIFAFWAMTDYYKLYEKVKPDFKAQIIVQSKKLLSGTFKGRTQPALLKKFEFSEFKRGEELIFNIKRKGEGRLYYGFRLNYAPKELLKMRDEGIRIEKHYETLDGKKLDKPVFKSGKDYVVVLKANTKQERHFVMLDDRVPAGFKVLNLSFQTESREAYKDVKKTDRWWGTFSHFENYEDRVLAFADSLYYGGHTYKYVVRAVTPGKYLLPPTKIEEMYDPDVFGYFGQQYVTVE